jgi:hypothetical protein
MRPTVVATALGLLACSACHKLLPLGQHDTRGHEASGGDLAADRASVPDRVASRELLLDRTPPPDHRRDAPPPDKARVDQRPPDHRRPDGSALSDNTAKVDTGYPCSTSGFTCTGAGGSVKCTGSCTCYATCGSATLTCNDTGGAVVQCYVQAGTGPSSACGNFGGTGCAVCAVAFPVCWSKL